MLALVLLFTFIYTLGQRTTTTTTILQQSGFYPGQPG